MFLLKDTWYASLWCARETARWEVCRWGPLASTSGALRVWPACRPWEKQVASEFFLRGEFLQKKLMITSKHEQWGRGGKSFLRLQTIKFLNSGGLMVESVLSEFTEYRYSWYSWPPERRVPRSLSPHYIQRKQRINRSKKVSDTTGSLSVQLLRSSCWQESSRSVWLRVSTTRCCTKHRNTKFKLYVRHRTVQRKEREKAC